MFRGLIVIQTLKSTFKLSGIDFLIPYVSLQSYCYLCNPTNQKK